MISLDASCKAGEDPDAALQEHSIRVEHVQPKFHCCIAI